MSETEDNERACVEELWGKNIRAVVESNDFHGVVEEESGRSSSVDYLDTYDDIPKETTKEYSEESNEEDKEHETFIEHKKPYETQRKEATQPAETEASVGVQDAEARREERVAPSSTVDGRGNENAPVGEWNTLPVLVERLRAALENSLATGSRRDDEPTPAVPEDSGIDSEEDLRIRNSMEQALGDCREPELKKDLKFLEDLLLSDIETALSRLRETLERIDVAALARNGAASDPSSKLHLLRLVSSLLSRLQVPEKGPEKSSEKSPEKAPERIPVLPSTSLSRRRRGSRHTIGVSAEELARARKWLEEERSTVPLSEVVISREQKEPVAERKPEEIRDKCTKDAINQRQLLEDKNKERENLYLGIQQVEVDKQSEESSTCQPQFRGSNSYQGKESSENSAEEIEERSRVSKLAAALRQRAELAASGVGKYAGGNKFTAKKSKIKRANTIDIPSYLKLQAESLGHESSGCVSLRRPINVGDKAAFNSANVTVPTFQPRTENDRKFLALITKNNEQPVLSPVAPFKAIGFTKNMDMSSTAKENWNSRFSNIKTTFDKPSANEEKDNKSSSVSRVARRFSGTAQIQSYAPAREKPDPGTNYLMKVEPTRGFQHAPSSPFRKIEKPSSVSPSKVPASYYWPKNTPAPTNTLREKARMMFDRETAPPKPRTDVEPQEKGFPRPPWLEHDRNDSKLNKTVTENGKLDYRSFCKQFAPFVGKGSSMEPKKYEERHREIAQRDRIPGVVDGKISFKMIPDRHIQTHQYPPVERCETKNKFTGETKNMFEVIKGGHGYNEIEPSKTAYPDATLRGSSSVAVQTGINDDHQDEGRSFRVAPKISKGSALVCSNASVQTSSELERPTISVSDADTGKQWKSLYSNIDQVPDSIYPPDDHQRFVLDHNQNYHTVPSDTEVNPLLSSSRQIPSDQSYRETVPYQIPQDYQKQIENYSIEDRETQGYSSTVSPGLSNYNQSKETSDSQENKSDWPTKSSNFLDDENIQNQDISSDAGVVTRYTCAIATVASSVDSPEPRSEEMAIDSRTSSSPSPSQWSWSKSRPPTSETATPEDEIRRHNLLQQSLVRRLQNEITSLNEQPSTLSQHLPVDQSRAFTQPASASQSHQPSFNQPSTYPQSYQSSSHQAHSVSQSVSSIQSHPASSSQPQSSTPIHQPSFPPANFDQPPTSHVGSRFAKFLAPVPQRKPEPPRTHSPNAVTANRVGALREAYEQPPTTQAKSIHKERSPVPNGVTPIDSSDEYLVSCATKPSRSIVLSKSESWHQLAISNSYPRAPRVNVPASTSSHPKPPKPKSPSSQKLRTQKQYEASSMADSVKKMEDKIRQYFDSPSEVETKEHLKNRRSPRSLGKGMVGLSRSRTMPGIPGDKLRLQVPTPQQVPLLNVNTADVDKVFDDLFEEATRTDGRQC